MRHPRLSHVWLDQGPVWRDESNQLLKTQHTRIGFPRRGRPACGMQQHRCELRRGLKASPAHRFRLLWRSDRACFFRCLQRRNRRLPTLKSRLRRLRHLRKRSPQMPSRQNQNRQTRIRQVTPRQTLRAPTTSVSCQHKRRRRNRSPRPILTATNARSPGKERNDLRLRTTLELVRVKCSPKTGGHKRDRVSSCTACFVCVLNSSISLLWDDAIPLRARCGRNLPTTTTFRHQGKRNSFACVATLVPRRRLIHARATRSSVQTFAFV